MSLISLLIALAAEKYLSSSAWQFNTYFKQYYQFFTGLKFFGSPNSSQVASAIFIILPVVLCYFLLTLVEDGFLHLVISTLVLIVCFGCVKTRECYKQYLTAAFKGEQTTCSMHHKQLKQDKNLEEMGFGQSLIWLNFRYFISVMLFFVVFGAPGALFYRLLAKVNEEQCENTECEKTEQVDSFNRTVIFWVDWLPVRLVSFGYMFVGHFSRALPTWLEYIFDVNKQPYRILAGVAQKSEDFMVDADDCTAEPCLLVRLAKRTLLLFLAVISILILTGVIS